MADERYTFAQARARLEEIVAQVRKKDVSLERSLDLLEEGVRLANVCTELSDHTEWRSVVAEQQEAEQEEGAGGAGPDAEASAGASEVEATGREGAARASGAGAAETGDGDEG